MSKRELNNYEEFKEKHGKVCWGWRIGMGSDGAALLLLLTSTTLPHTSEHQRPCS